MRRCASTQSLSQAYIKLRQPILKGLQSKPAKDQSNAQYPQPPLRKVISVVFNVRIQRRPDASDNPNHEPHTNRKGPRVVHVMDEGATDEGCGNVADRTDYSSPKLTTRKPWTARCSIVHSGTHATRVGEYLAGCDENGKCNCESETQNPIQSSSESKAADGRK